jgi:phosphomethylpyrimidine synthase
MHGADFFCYVTPAEHLCLPNIEDVKMGVIASKIAAQSADVAKRVNNAVKKDFNMSKARKELNWKSIFLN